jgi:hypothetical protein
MASGGVWWRRLVSVWPASGRTRPAKDFCWKVQVNEPALKMHMARDFFELFSLSLKKVRVE